jgi:hypothetical protein
VSVKIAFVVLTDALRRRLASRPEQQERFVMPDEMLCSTEDLTLSNPVELDWYGSPSDVVHVTPRDQQRFEIQLTRVIELLQLQNHAEAQLNLLLNKLGNWLRDHSGAFCAAYLTLRDARLAFIVISKTPECDDSLEDAVSELDFEVANDADLNIVRMNALVLPPASHEALSSFFDSRFLLVYRGI